MTSTGQSSTHGDIEWEAIGWAFPPDGQSVTYQQLSVMVATDGVGTVALRADAQVIWDPVRAATSLIAQGDVQSITVTQTPGFGGVASTTAPGRTVTSTNRSIVDHYVSVVDALPVDDMGVVSCPALSGVGFRVDFTRSGGAVVATVAGNEEECGGLSLTVDGTQQAGLSDPNRRLLNLVSTTLGVPLAS
jgi:hypothetical protein